MGDNYYFQVGDEWPDDEPPLMPPLEDVPETHDVPGRPAAMNEGRRGYLVEAAVMWRRMYHPWHSRGWDAYDPREGDRVEITHAVRRCKSGRPGQLHITDKQVREADRVAWRVLERGEWRVVWRAEYDMVAVRDVVRSYGSAWIPWTAVRDRLTYDDEMSAREHARHTGFLGATVVEDRWYD